MSNAPSSRIDLFHVCFLPHHTDEKVHTQLNNLYGDDRPDLFPLFNNGELNIEDVKDDDALHAIVLTQVSRQLISPYATVTSNVAVIDRIIQDAAFFVEIGRSQSRLHKNSLIKAITKALNTPKQDSIKIRISINHLYFDISDGPITFLDWSKFTYTRPEAAPTTVAAPTAAEIATAIG